MKKRIIIYAEYIVKVIYKEVIYTYNESIKF